jgi:hypothetical protein
MFASTPAPCGIAPGTRLAAGILNVVLPFTSGTIPDVKGPANNCTLPVGTGFPPAAATVTVTVSVCASAIFDADDTVTTGV